MLRGTALAALLLVLLLPRPAARAGEGLQEQQARWLLRVLAYDRNLRARAGSVVTIAIAGRGAEDAAPCQALAAALSAQTERARLAGLPVRAIFIEYTEVGPFAARLIAERAVAVYVCAGLSDRVAALAHIGQRRGILMVGGAEGDVRAGLGVGVVPRAGQLVVLVNLPAARAQGADLDAAFLRVAEVIQ